MAARARASVEHAAAIAIDGGGAASDEAGRRRSVGTRTNGDNNDGPRRVRSKEARRGDIAAAMSVVVLRDRKQARGTAAEDSAGGGLVATRWCSLKPRCGSEGAMHASRRDGGVGRRSDEGKAEESRHNATLRRSRLVVSATRRRGGGSMTLWRRRTTDAPAEEAAEGAGEREGGNGTCLRHHRKRRASRGKRLRHWRSGNRRQSVARCTGEAARERKRRRGGAPRKLRKG